MEQNHICDRIMNDGKSYFWDFLVKYKTWSAVFSLEFIVFSSTSLKLLILTMWLPQLLNMKLEFEGAAEGL